MSGDRHPGISIHKLPVAGDFVGFVFAVGCALIFVLGFPSLWYFVAFSAALGVGVAIILRLVSRHQSERNRPLSIFSGAVETENPAVSERERPRHLFYSLPRPFSA